MMTEKNNECARVENNVQRVRYEAAGPRRLALSAERDREGRICVSVEGPADVSALSAEEFVSLASRLLVCGREGDRVRAYSGDCVRAYSGDCVAQPAAPATPQEAAGMPAHRQATGVVADILSLRDKLHVVPSYYDDIKSQIVLDLRIVSRDSMARLQEVYAIYAAELFREPALFAALYMALNSYLVRKECGRPKSPAKIEAYETLLKKTLRRAENEYSVEDLTLFLDKTNLGKPLKENNKKPNKK